MEKTEEKIIKERKEKLKKILFEKRNLIVLLIILGLLIFAWHIRTVNVPGLKDVTTSNYTLGPDLDPYLFLRYAKLIVEKGYLPNYDDMRYVPLGYDTRGETRLLPYMIAYFYKIFHFESVEKAAVYFPAFMFLLTVIAFFLFVRKLFEEEKYRDIIAIISSLLLIVSPSLLPRTIAGIPEKESAGFFFLFLSFYFYVSALKSKKIKSSLIFSFFAGLSTALMGLIWGGWIYIFATIGIFSFISFLFGKIKKKEFYVYSLWFFLSVIIPSIFSKRYSIKGLLYSSTSGLCFLMFFLFLIDFIIFETKIKEKKFVKENERRLSRQIFSIVSTLIVLSILTTTIFGIRFIPTMVEDVIRPLMKPYYDRLSFTVAENKQPYFTDWAGSFGPSLPRSNFPLLFWLFFIGSIVLLSKAVKFERKEKNILIFSYTVFLFFLIFSRTSSSSILNGNNLVSKFMYLSGFLIIIYSFCYIYYNYKKNNKLKFLQKINLPYLFLLSYFIISIIGARSAIRLIMGLSPTAVILASFLCCDIVEKGKFEKNENLKTFFIVLSIIIIVFLFYIFLIHEKTTIISAKSMVKVPIDKNIVSLNMLYHQQWQKAMAWVRENTSKDAVFAHWWDYGYWVQTIGERATILDGGNAIPYWDFLMGRHVLTARNETEALQFLYVHNATHLLIDSTEIGKYGAYSSIGSDENYDRYSQISTFFRNDKMTREMKNKTSYIYTGGTFLDEDYKIEKGGKIYFLPAFKAGVGGVEIDIDKEGNFTKAYVFFIYQGNQIKLPLRYVYYDKKLYDLGKGYGGCFYFIPYYNQYANSIEKKEVGMFISQKSMKDLWVKLYLFNESKNFKLVHVEENEIVRNLNELLKQQNKSIGEFVYYGGIQGPIKIWKINYPKNFKIDEKLKKLYLQKNYPKKELEIAKIMF